MKKAAFLLFIVLAIPSYCLSNDNPRLKKTAKGVSLILPDKMEKALKKYNPKFKTWKLSEFVQTHIKEQYRITNRQAPFAVIGDFNGDGIQDAGLYGHDNKHDIIVCLLSNQNDFKAIELKIAGLSDPSKKWVGSQKGPNGPLEKEYGLDNYLFLFSKGIADFGVNGKLNLMNEAFEWNIAFKGSVLYYFKNGKFNEFRSGC